MYYIMKHILRLTIPLTFLLLHPGISRSEEYSETMQWKACVREARRLHPDLQAAAQKVRQAKASKEITRSALLPQITGNASEVTSRDISFAGSGGSISTGNAGSSEPGQTTTYDFGATAQQLLFDGFKSSYNLSGAERNIISSRYNYDVTSSNIRLRLRSAFVELLRSQELVKVTEDIETRRRQNLELVKLKYEGGREHKGSLLTAEADLAQASYEVTQAKRNIYLSQRRLTKELGRSFFIPMSARGGLEVAEPQHERPDFENIAQTTPLLQQLIAQKEAARFGVKSAYAQFFPTIYGTASASNSSTRWPPDQNDWSIGTSMSVPFFDGGNMIANVTKAKAALGQAEEDERSGRDGVILTLSDTWTKLQNALDNVNVQKKFLEATQERARISRAEYSIGMTSFDNWIIIENNLVSSQKTYVNAEADSLIAEANWIQAKGGTLDYDG
ncbi:MAG: TolC family protein [Candidatus Omnitrophica bacterium]|nr:TolC family protein [Candidatus Omnitrophota bacterium]